MEHINYNNYYPIIYSIIQNKPYLTSIDITDYLITHHPEFRKVKKQSVARNIRSLMRKKGLAWNKYIDSVSKDNIKPYLDLIHKEEVEKEIHQDKDGIVTYNARKLEKPITSEKEAIEFFEVDIEKYDVSFTWKAYDVSMKIRVPYDKLTGEKVKEGDISDNIIYKDETIKRTNYSCSLITYPIQKLILKENFLLPPIIVPMLGKPQMWLIITDVHRPFHNKTLWNGLLNLISIHKSNIYGLIINGDYLDLRSLLGEKHDQYIPKGIDLGYEYNDGRLGIEELKQAFGEDWMSLNKIFHYGNHEDRYFRNESALRKYGNALESVDEALRLNEYKFNILYDWKNSYTTLGTSLEIFHGNYLGKTAAKKHLEANPYRSCIFGHTHASQYYSNQQHEAYNIGWLGDVNSEGFKYTSRDSRIMWKNGFCITYIADTGEHKVNTIQAINDKFFFGGKIY